MLRQSTLNLKSRILDCFDFLQKSRNDGVGGIVIAICFAFCAVIARRFIAEAIHKIKSFCYFLLSQKVESPYPIDSNPQSEIPLIRSWLIYFIYRFKSRVLDTSLHCVTLSMTKFLPYHDKTKRVVILRALARSIHFGDFRILCDSRTLSESVRLNFIRFARFVHFGLLRRLQGLAMTIQHRFAQSIRFATFHTTLKGIKMQT